MCLGALFDPQALAVACYEDHQAYTGSNVYYNTFPLDLACLCTP